MRSRRLKLVSFVLLALQLVLGLQLQVAQAAVSPLTVGARTARPSAVASTHGAVAATTTLVATSTANAVAATTPAAASTANTAAQGATPPETSAVASLGGATAQADCPMHDGGRGAAHTAGTNKHAPMGDHNCCHASACQCHCVYTPAAVGLPALSDNARYAAVPSLASTQFVAPRIDDFLRPPIALIQHD